MLTRDEDELRLRAAWLYHMEGMTQAEIAERLGITRLRVNRILGEARQSGLVSITLNSRLASSIALEQELKEACGLAEAVIVPTPTDIEQIHLALGRAAADYLSHLIATTPVSSIGIGWGSTLRAMIGHVRPVQRPDITVNSMMGGLTHGFEMNTFEIASDLARRLDAQCNYLAAPIYAGSPESCATILEQDVFREAFERIASVDVALVSVGDMSNRSLQIRYGLPPDVSAEDLVRAGAVGDIMGRFLDADGHPVDHPLSRRVIAPSLETLRAIPRVIIASGGLHKAAIVAAVLKARLCSVLISDEDTARKALTLFET